MKTGGLVIVGLGAVGLAVAAAVVLKKKPAAPGTPGAQPSPGSPGATPGTPGVPTVLPPSLAAALVFVQDATTVHLTQGQSYRARVNLPAIGLPPFNSSATATDIGKGLSALGFVGVHVFMSTSDLPADWPASTTQGIQPGTRWFQGQWSGLTADVPKHPVVEQVWVSGPGLVSQATTTSGLRDYRGPRRASMTG